jgi:hypothetical protein
MAALFAPKRVYQKLMSKNEHNPTPSQPIKSWTRLSALTNKSIKAVNKVR